MNRVIDSIQVQNPCTIVDPTAHGTGPTAVKDYNRAVENQRSGKFDLEEGIQAALCSFTPSGSSISWSLDQIKDLNQSVSELVRANNVRHNPNNVSSPA